MSTITKSRTGRTIVDLDGYSTYYRAYVQGNLTGTVSIPAAVAEGKGDDELYDIAKIALGAPCAYDRRDMFRLGVRITRAAGRVQ